MAHVSVVNMCLSYSCRILPSEGPPLGETTRPRPFLAPRYTTSTTSMNSCLSVIAQFTCSAGAVLRRLLAVAGRQRCKKNPQRANLVIVSRAQVYHYVLRMNKSLLALSMVAHGKHVLKIVHTLFLKKNIMVQGSYSSYMVLKSGTWRQSGDTLESLRAQWAQQLGGHSKDGRHP